MTDHGQTDAMRLAQKSREDHLLIEAILRTMRQPLVVLDAALTVERANRAFYATFGVGEAKTERRKIYDLGNGQWDIPELRRLLEEILPNSGEVTDFRVEHEFEQIGRRVMLLNAYRMKSGGQNDHILLSLEDVTEREKVREELQGQKELAEKIVDASRDPLLILTNDLRVEAANATFYETFRVNPAETKGRLVYELGNGQWNIPKLRDLLENVLPDNDAFDDFRVEHNFEEIGRRTMVLNARRVDHMQLILLAIEDQTEVRETSSRLENSEGRLRLIMQSMSDAIYVGTADGITFANPPALKQLGYESYKELDQHISQLAEQIQTRDFATGAVISGEDQALARALRGENVVQDVSIINRRTGEQRVLRCAASPLVEGGRIVAAVAVNTDITDQKKTEAALRESEERLRNAVEVGGIGLWDWNLRTGELHWSDQHFRMEGYEVGEVTPSYEAWASRLHPEDRAETEAAISRARDDRAEYEHEFRVVHPDGAVHWLSARGRFSYDEAGSPLRMVGAMVDMTERRELEEHQKVLIGELQHRTMNLIGVVQSIADKTARASADVDDFRRRFRERLQALARVHRLLSQLDEHHRVSFDALLDAEFSALDGGTEQVIRDGPSGIPLRSSSVQTLALALHELATNAVKYGALAQPGGRLAVTWTLDECEGEPWLHIDWRESGVDMPPEGAEPQGTGQGRELIERALPYQLDARTSYELGPDGVHCTISMPVSLQTEAARGQ